MRSLNKVSGMGYYYGSDAIFKYFFKVKLSYLPRQMRLVVRGHSALQCL